MAAIYCFGLYCDDCADSIRRRIARELFNSPNPRIAPNGVDVSHCDSVHQLCNILLNMVEYDSNEYPKDCDVHGIPEHCCNPDCLDPEVLSDGSKIGHFFRNDLDYEGETYAAEVIRNGGPIADLWHECYDYLDVENRS